MISLTQAGKINLKWISNLRKKRPSKTNCNTRLLNLSKKRPIFSKWQEIRVQRSRFTSVICWIFCLGIWKRENKGKCQQMLWSENDQRVLTNQINSLFIFPLIHSFTLFHFRFNFYLETQSVDQRIEAEQKKQNEKSKSIGRRERPNADKISNIPEKWILTFELWLTQAYLAS